MQEKRRNIDPEDEPPEKENRVALNAVGEFDGDLYSGGKSKFEGYHTSLAVDDQEVRNSIFLWFLTVVWAGFPNMGRVIPNIIFKLRTLI